MRNMNKLMATGLAATTFAAAPAALGRAPSMNAEVEGALQGLALRAFADNDLGTPRVVPEGAAAFLEASKRAPSWCGKHAGKTVVKALVSYENNAVDLNQVLSLSIQEGTFKPSGQLRKGTEVDSQIANPISSVSETTYGASTSTSRPRTIFMSTHPQPGQFRLNEDRLAAWDHTANFLITMGQGGDCPKPLQPITP